MCFMASKKSYMQEEVQCFLILLNGRSAFYPKCSRPRFGSCFGDRNGEEGSQGRAKRETHHETMSSLDLFGMFGMFWMFVL